MNEEWRPVVGYEGIYEVSNMGNVRSVDRTVSRKVGKGADPDRLIFIFAKGVLLTPGISGNGYPTVSLCGKTHTVHSIVITTFRGPPPKGEECRHRNGNRTDPRLDNLEWGTRKENISDMVKHGTKMIGEKYKSSKITDASAKEIMLLRGKISQSKIAEMFNVSPSAVQAIHDKRTWKHVN